MSNPYPNYKRNTITVPAQKRPQNCGTSYCSCIECVMEPAQQEPVALGYMNAGHVHEMQQGRLPYGYVYPKEGVGAHVALYTSPSAQRKPLDAGEISRLWKQHTSEDGPHHNPYDDDGLGFARAIEAKLKEKNT